MTSKINSVIQTSRLHVNNLTKAIRKSLPAVTEPNRKLPQLYYLPISLGLLTVASTIMSIKKVDDDESLKEIYELDNDAFAHLDPMEDFNEFKEFLRSEKLTTYSINDKKGNIMGYYQLEPIKDGNLYIDSIGLKREYRKTPQGNDAIKCAWTEILKFAIENNVETLSLHVAANNKALLNLYTKLGFKIKETLPDYYEGVDAYYMELTIPKTEENEAEENIDDGLSPQERAEKNYINDFFRVGTELYEQGCERPENIITLCSYIDNNGCVHFSENLYSAYKRLTSIMGPLNWDSEDIFKNISKKDDLGNVSIDPSILDIIENLSKEGIGSSEIKSIIEKARLKDGSISFDVLQLANDIKKYNKSIDFYIRQCFDKKGFNSDVAQIYRLCAENNIEVHNVEYITDFMVTEKDGIKTVKPSSYFQAVKDEINKGWFERKIDSYSVLKWMKESGCTLEEYFEYHHLFKGKGFSPNEIACIISTMFLRQGKYNQQSKIVDYNMIDIYKTYKDIIINYSDSTRKELALSRLINACKVYDPIDGERFDENLMQKAIQLMERGIPLVTKSESSTYSPIVAMIEVCKKKSHSFLGEKIEFDETIFEKALENVTTNSEENENLLKILNLCKYYDESSKEERFDYEGFEVSKDFIKLGISSDIIDALKTSNGVNKNLVKICVENPNYDILFDEYRLEDGSIQYKFNPKRLEAYNKLSSNPQLFLADCNKDSQIRRILDACIIPNGNTGKGIFLQEKFDIAFKLLESGVNDVFHIDLALSEKSQAQIQEFKKLLDLGLDLISARKIIDECFIANQIDKEKYNYFLELYKLGIRGVNIKKAYDSCFDIVGPSLGILESKYVFNDLAYSRLKEIVAKGYSYRIIAECKDGNVFKDRIFRYAMDLIDKNYPSVAVVSILNACHLNENQVDKNYEVPKFSQMLYDKVFELEKIGISKENIAQIIKACTRKNVFSEEAYKKVPELYYKGYEDTAIATLISKSFDTESNNFNNETFTAIINFTKNYKKLKDATTPNGGEVIEKLLIYKDLIVSFAKTFGNDVLDYATSMKITNLIKFVLRCKNIINIPSANIIEELNAHLSELTSPEQKIKRLQIISAMAQKVNENILLELISKITSPKVTDTQKEAINRIFTDESLDYDAQIEAFIAEMNVPKHNIEHVREFLLKAKINEQIVKPDSIEAQIAQLDSFAQQMLNRPNVPYEKKQEYIRNLQAKKEDMLAHPEKYTTPKILTKVLTKLEKMVEAYINVPNLDMEFNKSAYETFYKFLDTTATPALIEKINYDPKLFDRLFATSSRFKTNFRALIELVKQNEEIPFNEARLILPPEGSKLYEIYEKYGLIEQVKANLDTRRKFELHGLDFEKWNRYDESLKGDKFVARVDTEEEYSKLKTNLVTELQGELLSKISETERTNLLNILKDNGFVIINETLFKDGEILSNSDIEKIVNIILDYIELDKYWKSALKENSTLPQSETDGAKGFVDHIKGIKIRFNEIKNAKNIEGIYVRLSNDNDIGRNIFFGNHVGCCNSVDSSYAGYSAPQHLLNSYNRGIEIVDDAGNSYGNSNCYFAVINGEVSFVIDSFEANGKLASNPIVTDKIIEFARKVCIEMGCPDAKIYFGPLYNHLNLSKAKATIASSFEVIGTVSAETYCDAVGGHALDSINMPQANRKLFVI